jgi:hypothetical protein
MGQKIHPIGFRLAVTRNWGSKWYADGKDFGSMLASDIRVREYLKKKLKLASGQRSGCCPVQHFLVAGTFLFLGKNLQNVQGGSIGMPAEQFLPLWFYRLNFSRRKLKQLRKFGCVHLLTSWRVIY